MNVHNNKIKHFYWFQFNGLIVEEKYQNPYIKEEQTTHWPKEKVQKDKQRSTKHTYKTKDQVTRTINQG